MKVKIIESYDAIIFADKLAPFLNDLEREHANVVDIQYQLRPIPNFSQGQTTFLYSAMIVYEPFQKSAIPQTDDPDKMDHKHDAERYMNHPNLSTYPSTDQPREDLMSMVTGKDDDDNA